MANAAMIQVSLNAYKPLKFSKHRRLPTGEIGSKTINVIFCKICKCLLLMIFFFLCCTEMSKQQLSPFYMNDLDVILLFAIK